MFVVFSFPFFSISDHSFLNRWGSMTPLCQFKDVQADVVRKTEGKEFVKHPPHFLFVIFY